MNTELIVLIAIWLVVIIIVGVGGFIIFTSIKQKRDEILDVLPEEDGSIAAHKDNKDDEEEEEEESAFYLVDEDEEDSLP